MVSILCFTAVAIGCLDGSYSARNWSTTRHGNCQSESFPLTLCPGLSIFCPFNEISTKIGDISDISLPSKWGECSILSAKTGGLDMTAESRER